MRKKVYCYLEDYISELGFTCSFREIGTGRLVQFKNTESLTEEDNKWFQQRMLAFMNEIRKLNIVFDRTFYNPNTTEDFIVVGGDVMKDDKNVLRFVINENSEFYIA